MQKIDIENLTADDMLDLIQDNQIGITFANAHNELGILAFNFMEGGYLEGRSTESISEAIRSWARKYNEMVGVSNG